MQRIIRDYYEKLYGNKMDNLEEIEIMNNLITSTEIEAVIKNPPPPPRKAQEKMASQENSIKYLEKN